MTQDHSGRMPWWKKALVWLDKENDRQLSYHSVPAPVSRAVQDNEVWLPAVLHASGSTHAEKAAQYCQCQFDIRKTGKVECVTTSAVILRNIVRDELASRQGKPPAPREMSTQVFVDRLDAAGLGAWGKRFSTSLPVIGGFMHPLLQLPHVLDMLAREFKDTYGRSFRWELTSGNTLDDLFDTLNNNRPTLIHGIWSSRVVNPWTGEIDLDIANLLGGFPHTMPLVSYSANDVWRFYDLGWRPGQPGHGFYQMTSEELINFWGRHYPLDSYTKRFSMTTLILDPE